MLAHCGECKKACKVIKVDFGYGTTEMHGNVSTHVDIHYVSDCCESDAFEDKECLTPIEIEEDPYH